MVCNKIVKTFKNQLEKHAAAKAALPVFLTLLGLSMSYWVLLAPSGSLCLGPSSPFLLTVFWLFVHWLTELHGIVLLILQGIQYKYTIYLFFECCVGLLVTIKFHLHAIVSYTTFQAFVVTNVLHKLCSVWVQYHMNYLFHSWVQNFNI